MKEKRYRSILYLDVQIQQEIDAKSMAFFTYPSKQKLFILISFLIFLSLNLNIKLNWNQQQKLI